MSWRKLPAQTAVSFYDFLASILSSRSTPTTPATSALGAVMAHAEVGHNVGTIETSQRAGSDACLDFGYTEHDASPSQQLADPKLCHYVFSFVYGMSNITLAP